VNYCPLDSSVALGDYEEVVGMIQKKQMVREELAGYKNSAIVLYQSPDGSISIDVRLEKETLWMDAHQMARLFGRDRSVIVRHIRNMYDTNELDQDSTYAKNAQVAADGRIFRGIFRGHNTIYR
jgi:hypothetical protein